jgi:hypothetical protein
MKIGTKLKGTSLSGTFRPDLNVEVTFKSSIVMFSDIAKQH